MTESKVEAPYVVVIDSQPPPLSTPPPLPPARKEPKNKEKRSPTQIIVLSSIIGILVGSLCVFVALYISENEKCNDESQRQTSGKQYNHFLRLDYYSCLSMANVSFTIPPRYGSNLST